MPTESLDFDCEFYIETADVTGDSADRRYAIKVYRYETSTSEGVYYYQLYKAGIYKRRLRVLFKRQADTNAAEVLTRMLYITILLPDSALVDSLTLGQAITIMLLIVATMPVFFFFCCKHETRCPSCGKHWAVKYKEVGILTYLYYTQKLFQDNQKCQCSYGINVNTVGMSGYTDMANNFARHFSILLIETKNTVYCVSD